MTIFKWRNAQNFFSFVQEIDPKKLRISQCQARNCLEKAEIGKCNRKRGRHSSKKENIHELQQC